MTSDRHNVALMLRAMFIRAHTVAELQTISGFSDRTVRAWLKTLVETGVVFIAEWRGQTAAYRCGLNVKSAEKPAALTRAQIQANYRERNAK